MKKSIPKLILAVIALALSLNAGAQTPAIAQKATASHSAPLRKVLHAPAKVEKLNLQPTRKIDNTVNGLMMRNKRAAAPRSASYRMPMDAAAAAPSAPLMGSVLYSNAWAATGTAQYGVYNVLDNGSVVQMFETSSSASFGGVAVEGKYYQTDLYEFWGEQYILHEIYDLETGEKIDEKIGESYTSLATDMTYDPKSGLVYGCFYNEDANGFNFCKMDLSTFTTTAICPIEMMWNACACDKQGNVFAIDRAGVLYSVDKSTGVQTEIGVTGVEPYYTSSATIDPATGVMYWTVSPLDENGYLFAVDTATAQATLICQFENGEEIAGLFFAVDDTEAGAPAAITDLVADFSEGELSGTISFTAPSKLFDGSTPTDNALAYTIAIDGEVVAEGATEYGAKVSADVTVAEAGTHVITAYVTNAAGDSPKAKVSMWIGNDSPLAPTNVKLTYADGKMSITWDPVEAGKNGGHIGEITYKVYREVNSGALEIVADGIADCDFAESVAEPEEIASYTYWVQAIADGIESEFSKSNSVTIGSVNAPYSIDFTSATSLDGFTLIDANDDGRVWTLTSIGVRITYNSSMDMDDWLITPPISMEGGKIYTFSFVASAESNNYPERIEAAFASAPTVEALSANIVVEPQTLNAVATEFTAVVTPSTSGKYYFGLHGCSYADKYYLNVRSLSISAGVGMDEPNAPTDLKVMPAADGSNSAVVSFKAPDKTIGDKAITSLIGATILVDGEPVATIDAPAPGADVSQAITVDAPGTYTISAYATSAAGAGMVATVKAYIGVNIPAAPTNVVATEIGNTGRVVVSWDAPTTDKDGNPINTELITYTVVNYFDEVLAQDVRSTSVEIVAYEGDGQIFDYFDVIAVTDAGPSAPASSPMIAIGTPFDMPVVEKFTDGKIDNGMGAIDYGAEWYVFDLQTLSNVMGVDMADADDSNGLTLMYGNSIGACADLFTGKINVTGDAPVLSFSYYKIADDDENYLQVYVKPADVDIETIVPEVYAMNAGDIEAWNSVFISLEQYKGQTVQIYFRGTVMTYTAIYLDAISVYNLHAYDLAVSSISAPAKAAPGEEFNVDVVVVNIGSNSIDEYCVELLLNGEVIDVANGKPIAFGEMASFSFAHAFTPIDAEENVFEATVVCANDDDTANNSLLYPVILDTPNYPRATNLNAQDTADGILLTWVEPNMADLPKEAMTDDFEQYDAFSLEAGEWTLIDVDGSEIGGISDVDLPVSACAFFVMDNSDESKFNESFDAHSGHKYMSTMYNLNGSKQSDWMISPALTGEAQTISFYAKSYTANYGLETLSVYYSTIDTNPESFVKISTEKVPAEWTLYTADLPVGAMYFAIVCESTDIFMLFVDDVTFIPANATSMELQLVGYNIYRDGEKINDAPVAETTYTDNTSTGIHQYVVTVVYAEGESGPSNTVSVTSSISSAISAVDIKVEGRTIVVTGAKDCVSVFSAEGKAVYSEASAARNAVDVAPGVYIVKADSNISKVIVR